MTVGDEVRLIPREIIDKQYPKQEYPELMQHLVRSGAFDQILTVQAIYRIPTGQVRVVVEEYNAQYINADCLVLASSAKAKYEILDKIYG